jgi:hypothetical protein
MAVIVVVVVVVPDICGRGWCGALVLVDLEVLENQSVTHLT